MSLKVNLNKIHSDLSQNFQPVLVSEKSSLEFGEYVEFSATNDNKNLIIIVEKRQLELGKFTWSYYANPISKDSLVERVSTPETLIEDVKDIFAKNRFDQQYLLEINK